MHSMIFSRCKYLICIFFILFLKIKRRRKKISTLFSTIFSIFSALAGFGYTVGGAIGMTLGSKVA